MFSLERYQCTQCEADLRRDGESRAVCVRCERIFPILHDVLDTLVEPSPEVIVELKGTAVEQGLLPEQWQSLKLRPTKDARELATLLQSSEADPGQYYQQTLMNFESALAELGALHGVRRVLEIGADYDYYFLKRFRDLGAECVALNIRFDVATPDPYRAWPEKVLADMNVLPFKAGSFDLVLMSATSHHSPDLVRTMREVARVLNADGRALIINDPVGGWLKGLGAVRQVKGPQRHHDIHENEYSLFEYRSAFRRAGLEPRYMFSEYHRQKLSNPARIHPKLRFARLARMLSIPWRVGPVAQLLGRYALLPAHAIFGLPLNVVARKSRPARAERQATSR